MAELWHYRIDGVVRGPATFAELKKLADAGQLAPSDFVRRDSQAHWLRASEVTNLWLRLPTATLPHDAPRQKPAPSPARSPPPELPAVEAEPMLPPPDPLVAKLARAVRPPPAAKRRAPEASPEKPTILVKVIPQAEAATHESANSPLPRRSLVSAAAPARQKSSTTKTFIALGLALFALAMAAPILVLWLRDQAIANKKPAAPAPTAPAPAAPAEQTLEQVAAELNAQTPAPLGAGVRADAVTSGPGARLNFLCTLTEVDLQFTGIDSAVFTREVKPGMIESLRSGGNRDFLRRHAVEVRYQFRDKNGRDAATVIISPGEV